MRSGAQGFALSDLYIKPERETAQRPQANQKMRAANGQWFEQLDMFSSLIQPDEQQGGDTHEPDPA